MNSELAKLYLAGSEIFMVTKNKAADRLAKLSAALEGAKSMLIVMQDNPDPDAMAAAAGLR